MLTVSPNRAFRPARISPTIDEYAAGLPVTSLSSNRFWLMLNQLVFQTPFIFLMTAQIARAWINLPFGRKRISSARPSSQKHGERSAQAHFLLERIPDITETIIQKNGSVIYKVGITISPFAPSAAFFPCSSIILTWQRSS